MPGEVRNQIYCYLLTTRYAYEEHEGIPSYAPLSIALLRVNRQVSREAISILHGENIWIILNTNRDWGNSLPIVSSKYTLPTQDPEWLAFRITMEKSDSPARRSTVLLGEEGIAYLVEQLWILSGVPRFRKAYLKLFLEFKLCPTMYHSASELQTKCLEPFTLVRRIPSFQILGGLETSYSMGLLHRWGSDFTTVKPILDIVKTFISNGDTLYVKGDIWSALIQYRRGKAFSLSANQSLRHYKLTNQEDDWQDFSDHRRLLCGTLLSHMMRPLLALSKYQIAKKVIEAHSCRFELSNLSIDEWANIQVCLFTIDISLKRHVLVDRSRARMNSVLGKGSSRLRCAIQKALVELFPKAVFEKLSPAGKVLAGAVEGQLARKRSSGEEPSDLETPGKRRRIDEER